MWVPVDPANLSSKPKVSFMLHVNNSVCKEYLFHYDSEYKNNSVP